MTTIVELMRPQLNAMGEEVHLANADSGWFAVTPSKWSTLVARARQDGRSGPNLIVYRTKTTDERDHWVVPYSVTEPLLISAAAPPRSNGSRRWELTLVGHKLRVTHHPVLVDVAAYHRIALPREAEFVDDPMEPTADPEVLDRRVALLRRSGAKRPVGNRTPQRLQLGGRLLYERRADVKAWVLQEAAGKCELCHFPAPFCDANGFPFLELHHVQQLAHHGPDTVENSVAVCPNCHRRLHHGPDIDGDRARLYRQNRRLKPQSTEKPGRKDPVR